jgi:anaerobic magnesium-protoporphyrin IX monomethyl ester cyclase
MRDLLLTHGYFLFEDPKERQIMKPYAPLGVLYLCSHLRAQGFEVDVFDTTFSSREDLYLLLRTEEPSVLGIYANLMTRSNVVEILGVARAAGWKTVVGGPEPGAYTLEYLQAGADFVVSGEGEITLQEMLQALRAGEADLSKIAGLSFFNHDGTLYQGAPRQQISNLDHQPWPARQAVDIARYVQTWRTHHGTGSVNFITARGCPFRCNWCSHQVYGQSHRRRDPVMVVDEVEWLLREYSPDFVWISDDVFTINHDWLRRYAAEMRRRSLRVPFECISRADRLNGEMLDLLAQLGCSRIWIGSESGSQRILDAMDRGVKVEQVRDSIRMARERGIQTGMFLMWGYEGEELDDIEATIRHVSTSNPDIFFTTVSYPIKGTPYYRSLAERLVQLEPWHKTSDRELRIRGRHTRQFYAHVDKLLRSEVERSRILQANSGREELELAVLEQTIRDARSSMQATWAEVEQ